MGFLVTVSGVFLLQLSKVDPETIQSSVLDRKSTILLAAVRAEVGSDEEKGVTSIEEPGMDSMRGGFGFVGSIHRALSSSRSMRRESGFNPSEVSKRNKNRRAGGESVEPGLAITRTQLYDHPMPSDSSDKISLYSNAPVSPLPTISKHSSEKEVTGRNRAISFANTADITTSFHEPNHDPFESLDAGSKARYNIPNFISRNSKPKDLETIRLVTRHGEESDEEGDESGTRMSRMESEHEL